MHGSLPATAKVAIKATARADSGKSLAVQTDSECQEWFVGPARDLLGSDPGLVLHLLTGISESSGYRYARGERPVPGNIIRFLLRSDQGEPWLNAIMEGSGAAWWKDLKLAADVGNAALARLRK